MADPGSESGPSGRAPQSARCSPRREAATTELEPGDRRSTRSRRTPRAREGQPVLARTRRRAGVHRAHREVGRGTTPDAGGTVGNGGSAAMERAARFPPRLRARSERSWRPLRWPGRRTAGGEQAAAMRHGCRRGANLRRVEAPAGTSDPIREAHEPRRSTRKKPGEPRPGTGCNTPGAVNGGSRRGGEKPRGRSETDGVAAVGRRRSSDLREWTFTGTSGDGPISRGRSSRRGRSAHREVSGPARLGENAEGEAKVGGGVTGTRERLGARPVDFRRHRKRCLASNRGAATGDGERQDGSVRKADDGQVHRDWRATARPRTPANATGGTLHLEAATGSC